MNKGVPNVDILPEAGSLFPSEVGPSIQRAGGNPSVRERGATWAYWKRWLDIGGSLVLITLLSPVYLVIGACLLVTGGEILFRQTRIGRGGVPFLCYKFRTMVPHADRALAQLLEQHPERRQEWVRFQKLSHDPRVTRFGRFLRRTSLDELPQFFNVLKGEMSLVGPRPVTASELHRYGRSLRWYLSVRPGVTGLWQVCRKSGTSYNQRVAMDSYYARHQSLRLDSWILLRTIPASVQRDAGI
jgi:lipopolysaccharide/colanic/teichoic acid biosynthesis glycosyltransferase